MNNRYAVLGIVLISVLGILATGQMATAGSTSYTFNASIGSVLNRGVILNSLSHTKTLQGAGKYTFNSSSPYTISTVATQSSPYTDVGYVPTGGTVPSASYNGGGVSFSTFTSSHNDNIMRIGRTQISSLESNSGKYKESEFLFVTGFPVFNQQANNFQAQSVGGAYQITFGNAIPAYAPGSKIQIFNQTWKIMNLSYPRGSVANSTLAVAGGNITLGGALTSLTTVYVMHNITSGPYTVQLTDLGQPNANGISPASVDIYYNNVLTNVSVIAPKHSETFYVYGQELNVYVNQTFAGLYAYQKWAKMVLSTNITLTNGHSVPMNPGWYTSLLWTNPTVGTPTSLYSIILYNVTPTTLAPGQNFSFVGLGSSKAPAVYFRGDTLGSSNFDNVQLSTSQVSSEDYQNLGTGPTNITEPAALLTVTSQINNSFSYAGQTGSMVTYILNPYELVEGAQLASSTKTIAALSYNNTASLVSNTQPLQVMVTGYLNAGSPAPVTVSVTFTSPKQKMTLPATFYNITGIEISNSRVLSGKVEIKVEGVSGTNTITLATLQSVNPAVAYSQPGKAYDFLSQTAARSLTYNQQNGQPITTFVLSGRTGNLNYAMNELPVSTSTKVLDTINVGMANYSLNNMTYMSTQSHSVLAGVGFRTEKGSKIVSVSPSSDTIALAKMVDHLQFTVN